jgi:hypothetical protein
MLLSITPEALAHEISQATQRVYYSGAGIDTEVSEMLIKRKLLNPSLEIIVVIDCTAHARRLGYGNQASIKLLQQHKIPIFQQQGVRLSFCIVDQDAWVFSTPPQLVEGAEQMNGFNCIQLTTQQIEPLVNQIRGLITHESAQDECSLFDFIDSEVDESNSNSHVKHNATLENKKFTQDIFSYDNLNHQLKSFNFLSKTKKLTVEKIMQLDKELEQNPPQRFDVSRQVQVFNSRVEFVEIELIGGSIDRHVFKFPDEIKKLISDDAEAQKRLSASYKLIDSTSKVSSKTISSKVDNLRRNFLKPMGKLGRVILRAQKENFNKQLKELEIEIEIYKKELEKSLEGELLKSKKGLISALIDRIKSNPPDELRHGVESKAVSKIQANAYLNALLEKYMPKTEDLLGAIKLNCEFKAVTYEMLSNAEFQKQLKIQFPYVEWDMPMEEYTAAKGE